MRGAHGYDPAKVPEIHPFFIASGPAFKKGLISNPIHMVDIYSLMCHILKVKPAPNNGSLDNVKHLLVEEPEKSPLFQTTTITCKFSKTTLQCLSITLPPRLSTQYFGVLKCFFLLCFSLNASHNLTPKSH